MPAYMMMPPRRCFRYATMICAMLPPAACCAPPFDMMMPLMPSCCHDCYAAAAATPLSIRFRHADIENNRRRARHMLFAAFAASSPF